ncbi:universal stress protein [Ammoniphilus sp. CFH 90114]|uniref:universal stress protein n=1 Tax=Ammoniphilus sp. CFH 90114 TaxID=2493665 RepID=UPI00100FAF5F|nr:universal stress protein [Ammoniphilus sp. CFH 90114]RXT15328.1 universal stress protein [Ammoniphilus sp. CFH 90114]
MYILIPVDGSEHSLKALNYAIDMAKAYGDELMILNVQPSFETMNTRRFFSKEDIAEYRNQLADEALEQAVRLVEESGLNFIKKLKIGVPKIEICNEVQENDVRCIVMGSRGKGPVIGTVIGSVSYGVLHEAPCPVTIVP